MRGTFGVQILLHFVLNLPSVDVDTIAYFRKGFCVWDCGMLGGADMKKSPHFCVGIQNACCALAGGTFFRLCHCVSFLFVAGNSFGFTSVLRVQYMLARRNRYFEWMEHG
jgi:hypothetical protein